MFVDWLYMGYTPATNKRVFFPLEYWGTCGILSKQRTGKTSLLEQLALEIYKIKRAFLVINPLGNVDWEKAKKMNFKSEYPEAIDELFVIKDFAMPISEFKTRDDFYYLGFSEGSCEIMARIVALKEYQLDFKKLDSLINDLPTKEEQMKSFRKKHPNLHEIVSNPTFSSTVLSLKNKWNSCKKWFWFFGDKRLRLTTNRFCEIWEKHRYVCLSLNSGDQNSTIEMSRAFVGILIQNIPDEFWKKMQPVVFIEEADKLLPEEKNDITQIFSLLAIRELCLKKLRFGIYVFYVTQIENVISRDILDTSLDMIVGKVKRSSYYFPYAQNNKVRNYDGIRRSSFVFLNINDEPIQFVPAITGCMC